MVKISKIATKIFRKACRENNVDPDESYLRLSLDGGEPTLEINNKKNNDDKEFELEDIHIILDPVSEMLIGDANIDYQEGEDSVGFIVNAPNICEGCPGDAGCC